MKKTYDLITIGGGAAGLTVAGIAANLGAKVCLIEAEKPGGDCTWTGCIPSKTLLKVASVAQCVRSAHQFGLVASEPAIDFEAVMDHVDHIRNEVYEDADAPEIFERMGIDVKSGRGRLIDRSSVEITRKDGTSDIVTGRFINISTGSRAAVPPIPGLDTVPYLTNDSLFELAHLPAQLSIIGAGPVGIEMAQAFSRLGAAVTVFDLADRILPRDDEELARLLQKTLSGEGIRFVTSAVIDHVSGSNSGGINLQYSVQGEKGREESSHLLIAAGRQPNTRGLGLDEVGIRYDRTGIHVDKACRTSVRHVYACGDVIGGPQFTHMAEHTAKVVTSRALLKIPMSRDGKHVPWVTYSDPELAHLGASPSELNKMGKKFRVYRFPFAKIDRAITDRETTGWIKVYATPRSGKILGVDILGAHAGEMIGEFALAMKNGISLRRFADTIHPYPTYALGARRAADQWYVGSQAAWQIKWIKRIFGYRGEVPDLTDPHRIV